MFTSQTHYLTPNCGTLFANTIWLYRMQALRKTKRLLLFSTLTSPFKTILVDTEGWSFQSAQVKIISTLELSLSWKIDPTVDVGEDKRTRPIYQSSLNGDSIQAPPTAILRTERLNNDQRAERGGCTSQGLRYQRIQTSAQWRQDCRIFEANFEASVNIS